MRISRGMFAPDCEMKYIVATSILKPHLNLVTVIVVHIYEYACASNIQKCNSLMAIQCLNIDQAQGGCLFRITCILLTLTLMQVKRCYLFKQCVLFSAP